jgi:hypothetical protein
MPTCGRRRVRTHDGALRLACSYIQRWAWHSVSASSILNPPGQRQQHTISPDEQSFADLLARWSRTPEVPGDAFIARQIRPLLAVTTIEEWEEVIGWVFRYSKNVESWKYPPAVFVAKAENFLRTYRNRIVGNLKNLYREGDLSMGRASEGLG